MTTKQGATIIARLRDRLPFTMHRSRSLALDQLRRALRDRRDGDVIAILRDDRAVLTGKMTAAERDAVEDALERHEALQPLRDVLVSGDDAAIVREAHAVGTTSFRYDHLHIGERLQIEQAIGRAEALTTLRAAVAKGNDDARAIVTAWWHAETLGCNISGELATAARAARQSCMKLEPRYPNVSVTTPIVSQPAAPPPDEIARLTARMRADQQRAIAALDAARVTGNEDEIVTAFRIVRQKGVPVPAHIWRDAHEIEERVADVAELRAALQDGPIGRVARAWAKAIARWPLETIDPAIHVQGHAAFRQWGAALRRTNRRGSRC